METLGLNDIEKSFFEEVENQNVAHELQKFKTLKDLDIVAYLANDAFQLKSYRKKFEDLSCSCFESEEKLYQDFHDFFSLLENDHVSFLESIQVFESLRDLQSFWLEEVLCIDEEKAGQILCMIGKDEFLYQLQCHGVQCCDAGLSKNLTARYVVLFN